MTTRRHLSLAATGGPFSSSCLLVLLCTGAALGQDNVSVSSPDGRNVVRFELSGDGAPTYSVERSGDQLLLPSRLGFAPDFVSGFSVIGSEERSHSDQWSFEFGERRDIPDVYQELTVKLEHETGRRMNLVFRAYDEGIALHYAFPEQSNGEFEFSDERTEFRLPGDTYGYEEHGTEGPYRRVPVEQIAPWCERPLTLEFENGVFAAIAEASNHRYPRMLLSALDGTAGALVSALGGRTSNTARPNQRHDSSISLRAGDASPWRVLLVGDRPGALLENNHLLLSLNPPCALEDTSWIKPGKVMRDTRKTTENSKKIIDFAKQAGLSYVHIDATWYGNEDARHGDATTVRVPNLDLQEIIRYGTEKGVGLTVYVDRRQIKSQRDELFKLYEEWGLAGVKLGFVDVGPQSETAWMTDTIAKAAEHHLLLNVHDGYRATGNNRTYPNLMTVEGIRGNEHMPTAEHNCTLPFTRYLCGIGDYTVCYYDDRIKTTHAHQLAMAVVSFSPLQWIFWYDTPDMYRGEPEVEFFREVPTVWDETRVLEGEIGRYATIARRSGDSWFVGAINAESPRRLELPLSFLTEGVEYDATIYYDDPSVDTRTHVGMRNERMTSAGELVVDLQRSGGAAFWIRPAGAAE